MWRVIDISGQGNYFHVKNRNILIEREGRKIDTVAFADINSIIIHGKCNSFSEEFFSSCIDNHIPVIFCDSRHVPSGMLLPWYQHTDSASRLLCQVYAKQPKRKRVWQKIIISKVKNQACLLRYVGQQKDADVLEVMANHVLSGDSTNIEAQAAKIYFQSLFGNDFIRHVPNYRNLCLDYGYTILRSLVARAVVGTGLCPSISIFHSNRINPFALVDDLMEPLRPFADEKVYGMPYESDNCALKPQEKQFLISLISLPVSLKGQTYELSNAVGIYVNSYYQFLKGEVKEISFPDFKR